MTETVQTQTHGFQTEVKELLSLVAHSLYSNKEIFLRELVSNAADAADKLRYKALSDDSLYEGDGELKVRLVIDQDQGTLTISDNGIGMNEAEAIEHLGTIAKSGTREFFSQLSGDESKDSQLIGQFGVGFYSSFIVADKVTVRSRKAGMPISEAVQWVSDGLGSFTTNTIEKRTRGTDVILHLKEEEKEFLDDWRLRTIVGKYSDHINIAVEMYQKPTEESEGSDGTKIEAKSGEWQQVNKATALWTRSQSEISDEDYREFYKHVSHDFSDPLIWAHNKVEGNQEYTSLLYIPEHAPWDMWNREQKHGLKLYVQRVFIMDDAEQFMPTYLRFVKGVLDSNDLSLNVSREILQDTKVTASLRKACTKRVLGMLEKLAKDDAEKYQSFWNEFGRVLKEGPAEDYANREKIGSLLRFSSTHQGDHTQNVSLDQYIERMDEKQDKIYYITADSFAAACHSPHLEIFRKKGIEVLLMWDRVDEWLINHFNEYKDKQLVSITKGELDLGDLDDESTQEQKKELEQNFASFIERAKGNLGEQIKEVRITHRLTDSPCCIVTDENDMSTQMMKLMQAAGQAIPPQKYILEVNPEHALIKKVADIQDDETFSEWMEVLLGQAQLSEQGGLEDPSNFVSKLNSLLMR